MNVLIAIVVVMIMVLITGIGVGVYIKIYVPFINKLNRKTPTVLEFLMLLGLFITATVVSFFVPMFILLSVQSRFRLLQQYRVPILATWAFLSFIYTMIKVLRARRNIQ